jgi:hypothetical protein
MRLIICLIPLLCGCTTPIVRCDAHMQPINPPAAASDGANGGAGGAPSGASKAAAARRAR